jgi:hypothetical protein
MRIPLVVCAALLVSLAGCKHHAKHDVAYYTAHDSERAAELAACNNDPGDLDATADCQNAKTADLNADFDPTKSPPSLKHVTGY